jgi:transcriptional regulator with XRE-family HTH domain
MNWIDLITQLNAHGLTQQQIAAACGCGQTTISEIAAGKTKDPRYGLGQKLIDLLAQQKEDTPPANLAQSATENVAMGA